MCIVLIFVFAFVAFALVIVIVIGIGIVIVIVIILVLVLVLVRPGLGRGRGLRLSRVPCVFVLCSGFHQLVVQEWDLSLSLDVICHWMQVLCSLVLPGLVSCDLV